jgi:hypothetical protein
VLPEQKKLFQVNFVNEQSVLQFVPDNSIGRHSFALLPSLLQVWSLQKCINILIFCRQIAALSLSLLCSWSLCKCVNIQIQLPFRSLVKSETEWYINTL